MSLNISRMFFVFIAGVFTLFSPCSFPLLPGFISYYIGNKASFGKALQSGIACTLGLLTFFSTIGIITFIFGSFLQRLIPFLQVIAGLIMIFFGAATFFDFTYPFVLFSPPKQRGLVGIFIYGVTYGMATLGCSAPIFFSIISYALVVSPFNSILTFFVYTLGMGLPIIMITILIVHAKTYLLKKIVSITPKLQKISGIILIFIGLYLIFYYIFLF